VITEGGVAHSKELLYNGQDNCFWLTGVIRGPASRSYGTESHRCRPKRYTAIFFSIWGAIYARSLSVVL
jgi:hypothetical protein